MRGREEQHPSGEVRATPGGEGIAGLGGGQREQGFPEHRQEGGEPLHTPCVSRVTEAGLPGWGWGHTGGEGAGAAGIRPLGLASLGDSG